MKCLSHLSSQKLKRIHWKTSAIAHVSGYSFFSEEFKNVFILICVFVIFFAFTFEVTLIPLSLFVDIIVLTKNDPALKDLCKTCVVKSKNEFYSSSCNNEKYVNMEILLK